MAVLVLELTNSSLQRFRMQNVMIITLFGKWKWTEHGGRNSVKIKEMECFIFIYFFLLIYFLNIDYYYYNHCYYLCDYSSFYYLAMINCALKSMVDGWSVFQVLCCLYLAFRFFVQARMKEESLHFTVCQGQPKIVTNFINKWKCDK